MESQKTLAFRDIQEIGPKPMYNGSGFMGNVFHKLCGVGHSTYMVYGRIREFGSPLRGSEHAPFNAGGR